MPDEAVHYFEEGLIDSMIVMYADDVRLWQRAFRRYYECIQEKREPRPDDSPDAVEYRINAYNVHVKETDRQEQGLKSSNRPIGAVFCFFIISLTEPI